MDSDIRKTDRVYWLCQAAGWGLYTLYVLTGTAQVERGWHLKSIVSVLLFLFVAGPIATHGLRAWILRHGWLAMPAARSLPRSIAFTVSASAILTTATGAFNVLVTHNGGWQDWWPRTMLGIFFGFCGAFAIWIRIYFSVHERRRRRAIELKALQLEAAAHDARLRTLEAQLNPHFLFNALNSVRALVVEDPQRAQTMITRLAELLRYTLNAGNRDVAALDDEMRAVEDYLAIERVRFEERLTVDIDVEPAARRQRVPRMLVLTLVENAVKHGIGRLTQGGSIRITAAVHGDRLRVCVANSGSLVAGATTPGVGLSNARERLQLIYGDRASLTLVPDDANGASVVASVSTPLLEREASAERHV